MSELSYKTSGFESEPAVSLSAFKYIEQYQQTPSSKSPVRAKKYGLAAFIVTQESVESFEKIAETFKLLEFDNERAFGGARLVNDSRKMHTPRIRWHDLGARRPSRVYTIKLPWHTMIKDAEKVEDILDSLRRQGDFDAIVQRLTDLDKAAKEEGRSIEFQSLQKFALFVRDNPRLHNMEMGINPNGLVQSVMRVPEYGTVAMNFLSSGEIMFAMVLYRRMPGARMHRVNGVMPPHRVMRYVKEFVDRIDA